MNPSRTFLPASLALLVAGVLPAQQALTPLTSSDDHHQDAAISPDGLQVVFKVGLGKIGRVSTRTGVESILVSSSQNDLFHVLWARNSLDLYYVQGNRVRSVSRSGGNPLILATLQGTSLRIWDVDPTGRTIVGSRRDAGLDHIFTLDTSGLFLPQDIVESPNVLDDIHVDPSGAVILYRSWPALPFANKEYYRADLDGGNQTLLHMTFFGDSAAWTDAGQTFAMTTLTPTEPPTLGLARVGPSGILELLTDADAVARRSTVSADTRWILFEAINPQGGGVNPAVMPGMGGGAVMLARGQNLIFNSGSLTGGLSMDHDNLLVAFSANRADIAGDPDQIYAVALDREIRVYPRVEVGKSLWIELPLELDELGFLALSTGVELGTPLTLVGVSGALELLSGPGEIAIVLSGAGTGTEPLSAQFDVPNDPTLIGQEFYFQGLRLPVSGPGAFTHWGWFTVF